MRRTRSRVKMLVAPLAVTLLMGLAGCVATVGDGGPEWGGPVLFGGGFDRGYHAQAFHAERGGHPVNARSSRGRASMGARGGGHAASGGHRK
jgi:hypothetical protein